MNFDRCNGQLSNFQTTMFSPSTYTFGTGVSVSPDSRYLYVTNTTVTYQYDLHSVDVFSTQTLVAQYDSFQSNGRPTYFFLNQLGPDGRIYVQTLHQNFHLHYIAFPNRGGNACELVQHGIETKTLSAYEIPNFPNFRLGPIDGSACDTLGFDNHPLCNWRWEREDTLSPLQVTFTDLSSYEPASWHWNFGDGTVSQDTSPVHTYAVNGTYQVCLVVGNQYSSDTLCRVVQLGTSAVQVPGMTESVAVWPNPFGSHLTATTDRAGVIRLFNSMGEQVRVANLGIGITEIETASLPPGMYFWEVRAVGEVVKAGKVIKIQR